ncbi:hypothetical protein PR048_031579 [Dryococelus australis]|uniref:Uncharacterized protein n=1 Tax=Dryococelus australis TaxID=614101 RepID=A0ABQ9G8C2_9NEOP|nr:hypothetical protein PR048_031579 [Dryococelus australis]
MKNQDGGMSICEGSAGEGVSRLLDSNRGEKLVVPRETSGNVLEVAAIDLEAGVQTIPKIVKGMCEDMLRVGIDSCVPRGLTLTQDKLEVGHLYPLLQEHRFCRCLLELTIVLLDHTTPDTALYFTAFIIGRPSSEEVAEVTVFRCPFTTKASRVRFLAGSLADFRKWESRRTMPLVGGLTRGFPAPSPCRWNPSLFRTHLASPSSALKTSKESPKSLHSIPLLTRRSAETTLVYKRFVGCTSMIGYEYLHEMRNPSEMRQQDAGSDCEKIPRRKIPHHSTGIILQLLAEDSRCVCGRERSKRRFIARFCELEGKWPLLMGVATQICTCYHRLKMRYTAYSSSAHVPTLTYPNRTHLSKSHGQQFDSKSVKKPGINYTALVRADIKGGMDPPRTISRRARESDTGDTNTHA